MLIRKKIKSHQLNEPMKHSDHHRPTTRREFISQGFSAGVGTLMMGSAFSLFSQPQSAFAALSSDLEALKSSCGIAVAGAGKIPFICFDLAGGANTAGSNVLVGGPNGQLDFLSTQGYSKLGLPGDMVPPILNPDTATRDFINTDLGLAFHSDSAMLLGILEKVGLTTQANTNGFVIPARSDNDTGNNPHNPMYGIARCGADGSLLTLIGSRTSESGGNSMAPDYLMDPQLRPTKVDRPSDVTGLVDTGDLIGLLTQDDAVAVMEAITRISQRKVARTSTGLTGSGTNRAGESVTADEVVKELIQCGYLQSADIADRFGNPATLNPSLDPLIVGDSGIFTADEYASDREFQKTASVMKMVVNGFSGAGTVTMGGYDYHDGSRATGERRDLRAGRCIGACLEYAARVGVPLMVYVFSDGSVFSNGSLDMSADGRGKGVWTGDNSSTGAVFSLIYNPNGRPQLLGATADAQARHQQLGYMRSDASVETSSSPAANNVNTLVEMVCLNYMALHGEASQFNNADRFPSSVISNNFIDTYSAFEPIVNGIIT